MSSDDMPRQPTTTQLEAVPAWAIKLTDKVVGGFANNDARFDKTDANIELVATDLKNTKEDLRVHKESVALRFTELERAPALTSQRVGAIAEARASKIGLEQEAKLGLLLAAKDEEIAKLKADSATKSDLATALDDAAKVQTEAIVAGVKATIDTIAKTPTAKRLTSAIVPVLMVAIAIIGIKLQASLSRLQAAPQQQSTVVQIAASPVPTDAGVDR